MPAASSSGSEVCAAERVSASITENLVFRRTTRTRVVYRSSCNCYTEWKTKAQIVKDFIECIQRPAS